MDNLDDTLVRYGHLSLLELRKVIDSMGIHMSEKELRRRSRLVGIKRRSIVEPDPAVLRELVQKEIAASPRTCGYRTIWHNLLVKHRVKIKRSTVMKLLAELAPEAVEERQCGVLKRRVYSNGGPNAIWHLDGYDKLKDFGFAVHGCVDGYSRKIIWLEVGPTNNDPSVVAGYFLQAAIDLGGLPKIVRSDCGTENVCIERIQTSIRSLRHTDSMAGKSFLYGTSTRNQRIERLWGSVKDMGLSDFITMFKSMERRGEFSTSNYCHIEALRYSFIDVIRQRLHDFTAMWNCHHIRKSRSLVTGKPVVLYCDQPNNLKPVQQGDFNAAAIYTTSVEDTDDNFRVFANYTLRNHPDYPADPDAAMNHSKASFRVLMRQL